MIFNARKCFMALDVLVAVNSNKIRRVDDSIIGT